MAEERRKSDIDLLEKIFKLESEVRRLTEHEAADRPRYERWHSEILEDLSRIERLLPSDLHQRMRELEARPFVIQLSPLQVKELFDKSFDERMEVWVGRMAIRVAVAMVLTFVAGVVTSILVYFGFKK